jgi:hypothetical protein
MAHNFSQASTFFRNDLREHPNDLGAWVGFMQCDPHAWPGEILRQEDALKKDNANLTARFKLGLLLAWQWSIQEPNKPREYPDKQRDRAMAMLESAWTAKPTVLHGMALGEVYDTLTGSYANGQVREIMNTLIHSLAGSAAYRQYREAQRQGWKIQPPAADLVPAENRRPLLAPVTWLWSQASAQGVMLVDRGKPVKNPKPLNRTADESARLSYYLMWRQGLRASVGFHR